MTSTMAITSKVVCPSNSGCKSFTYTPTEQVRWILSKRR
jgi:hypothetical protein